MKLNTKYIAGFMIAVALLGATYYSLSNPGKAVADVNDADYGTTTNATTWTTNVPKLVKNGPGTLSRVIVFKSSNAEVNLYNATTTNINLRTGGVATSTILLGSIGAGATSGTYNFNEQFGTGLIVEVVSSVGIASTTITWK